MHKLPRAVQPSVAHTIHVSGQADHMQLDNQFIAYLSECGYTRHCVLVRMRLYTSLRTCQNAAIHVIAYLSECGYTRHCVLVGMRLYTALRTCRYAAIHGIAYLSECGYTRHCVLVGMRLYTSTSPVASLKLLL